MYVYFIISFLFVFLSFFVFFSYCDFNFYCFNVAFVRINVFIIMRFRCYDAAGAECSAGDCQ